jgi:iron complex transport system substrate-binding protein
VRILLVPVVVLTLASCGSNGTADTDGIDGTDGTAGTAGPITTSAPDTAGAPSSSAAAEAAPSLPVTFMDDSGREVTVASADRIVPVNGDLAEVVFALGLGEQVVATDLSATYPPEADAKPEIGYQRALQTEPILALEPTVVLADELAGPPETLEQLRTAGVPVVVIERDRTVDGPAAKIRAVGRALGVPQRADELAEQVSAEITSAISQVPAAASDRPRVLALYLRGETVQLVFGRGSGIDALVEAAGGINVGTELGIDDTRQLTTEAVVAAAPDVVLVTTTGLESVGGVDGLLGVAGIGRTPAGRDRRVLTYEDQFLYGFGPRTGQLLSELAGALHPNPTTSEGA